jgi:hypothetical protein
MNKKSKGNRKMLFGFITVLLILLLFFYWQNNDIVVTKQEYTNSAIPDSFQGYQILHVSDLHNKEFGKNQKRLIKHTTNIDPDLIVITGDIIDSNRTNISVVMDYINQAIQIAPIYYVSGNHEKWSGVYPELTERLQNAGVVILDNDSTIIESNGDKINLFGLMDPDFMPSDSNASTVILEELDNLIAKSQSDFTILLSHRPELISVYAEKEIDLVFSGHAHGGQFRIPFIGGFIAPNQGFFPKYTSGVAVKEGTSMIVSRGLGNSIIPVRIFNRPELVVVTLSND